MCSASFKQLKCVPDHLCLKTLSRCYKACTPLLLAPIFYCVMSHAADKPALGSAHTSVVSLSAHRLAVFHALFPLLLWGCGEMPCAGIWGSLWVIPVGTTGWEGAVGALCAGISPLGSCSCFWGCWSMVSTFLWPLGAISPVRRL